MSVLLVISSVKMKPVAKKLRARRQLSGQTWHPTRERLSLPRHQSSLHSLRSLDPNRTTHAQRRSAADASNLAKTTLFSFPRLAQPRPWRARDGHQTSSEHQIRSLAQYRPRGVPADASSLAGRSSMRRSQSAQTRTGPPSRPNSRAPSTRRTRKRRSLRPTGSRSNCTGVSPGATPPSVPSPRVVLELTTKLARLRQA